MVWRIRVSLALLKVEELNKKLSTTTPCTIHTFGFGTDHDANLLKAISDKAEGVYFFVQNKDQIADAFTDCLGGLLSVVGQNLSLTIQPQEGITINHVNTAFKVTQEGSAHVVHIGDIQSEEQRDILVDLSFGSMPSVTESTSLFKLTLSYFNVISSKQEIVESVASLSRSEDIPIQASMKVDQQKNRILAANALAKAKIEGDKLEIAKGRETLTEAITTIQNSISKDDPFVQSLIEDLKKARDSMRDQTSYTSYGQHNMTSAISSHSNQRSATTTRGYTTSSRATVTSNYYST